MLNLKNSFKKERHVTTSKLRANWNGEDTTTLVWHRRTREIVERSKKRKLCDTDRDWRKPRRPFRIVTIVLLQLLQRKSREQGRVLRQHVQPSWKKIRTLFPRIPESGGVSGGELKLYFINPKLPEDVLSWIQLTSKFIFRSWKAMS